MRSAAGGALGNWIDGKDAMSGALINGAGSAAGYGIGKAISNGANASVNWWKGAGIQNLTLSCRNTLKLKVEWAFQKK